MDSPSWMMYISIVVLIMCSAFFSASETAISTFNRIRLRKQSQDGSIPARKTLEIADRYEKLIATILVGNNLVNIAASTISTIVATALFGPSGAVISTIVMTLLVLTFGEVLPKSYAKQNADTIALRFSGILRLLMTVLTPITFAFTRLGSAFAKAADDPDAPPSVTEEELMYFIDSIEEEGVIEEQERDLVQSALEFDETNLKEVITPRVNVIAVDIDDPIEEITDLILEEGYSRVPVYENTVDNIIGILYTKEFLRNVIQGKPIDLREMLHEPYFVHKGMRLPQLLTNLKNRKIHMAVVLDEYGGTYGIVTMEDLVEELVGDIWDEDDEIPGGLVQLDENRYEVSGSHDISEMLEELGYPEEDENSDHTTVSGWAMHHLEHIPETGESFIYEDLHCTVLEMDGHRITKLGLERIPPADPDGQLQEPEQTGA